MDPKILSTVGQLSNQDLLARIRSLAQSEREVIAALIAHLAELDERRLYLAEGYSSLFSYCTQVLHLSEHAVYGRIEAARLVRRFPVLLDMLEEGSVNLTTVCLIASQLTVENHGELLDMIRHKSKRQVEELLARLRPQPPVPASVRRLPTVGHAAGPSHPVPRPVSTQPVSGHPVRLWKLSRRLGPDRVRPRTLLACHRRRPKPVPPSSPRWRPSATRCSSRRAPRRSRSSGAPRRCCAIRSRMEIRQRFSIEP